MYTDIYNDYSDETFEYDYPISFDLRNKDYLMNKYEPEFTWNYGDNTSLEFTLGTQAIGTNVRVTFYNIRHEVVYAPNIINGASTITVVIDTETSSTIFKKGIYFCSIQLEYEEDSKDIVKTVQNADDCCIYVK